MMRALFPLWRIASMLVKTGADAFLDGLHDFFILDFYLPQAGACPLVQFRSVIDKREEGDPGAVYCQRFYQIER